MLVVEPSLFIETNNMMASRLGGTTHELMFVSENFQSSHTFSIIFLPTLKHSQ